MEMPRREIYLSFQLDTNRINSRGKLANMNRLQKWHEADICDIILSDTMIAEATADNDPLRTQKAYEYVYSITTEDMNDGDPRWKAIENLLFPKGASTPNEQNDVMIVFTADKFGRILVTNDGGSKRQPGGILGNRGKLRQLGIRVMSDDEAVDLVVEALKQRDESAYFIASHTGQPLPDWVGKDF
jgi:hypothetical protein